MSVSLTGRHHDWLSLTPRSIRSNGIQARYGRKAGARGRGVSRDGQGESFCCDQFVLFVRVEPCGRDRRTFARGPGSHCIQLSTDWQAVFSICLPLTHTHTHTHTHTDVLSVTFTRLLHSLYIQILRVSYSKFYLIMDRIFMVPHAISRLA